MSQQYRRMLRVSVSISGLLLVFIAMTKLMKVNIRAPKMSDHCIGSLSLPFSERYKIANVANSDGASIAVAPQLTGISDVMAAAVTSTAAEIAIVFLFSIMFMILRIIFRCGYIYLHQLGIESLFNLAVGEAENKSVDVAPVTFDCQVAGLIKHRI